MPPRDIYLTSLETPSLFVCLFSFSFSFSFFFFLFCFILFCFCFFLTGIEGWEHFFSSSVYILPALCVLFSCTSTLKISPLHEIKLRMSFLESDTSYLLKARFGFYFLTYLTLFYCYLEWSSWGAWGTCSATACGGRQSRTRSCLSCGRSSTSCLGDSSESRDCNVREHPGKLLTASATAYLNIIDVTFEH